MLALEHKMSREISCMHRECSPLPKKGKSNSAYPLAPWSSLQGINANPGGETKVTLSVLRAFLEALLYSLCYIISSESQLRPRLAFYYPMLVRATFKW